MRAKCAVDGYTGRESWKRMVTSRRKGVVLLVLVLCSIGAGWYYSTWWDRLEYRRWLAERQRQLEALGSRMLVYASNHGGGPPQNLEDAIAAGVLATAEIEWTDPWRAVKVRREFRPIPTTKDRDALLLVVETYDPAVDAEFNALFADGHAVCYRHRGDLIAQDNALRRQHDLPEIP